MTSAAERILVIKLGALGDFILALGPAAAIRAHHPDARITLLTTAPYAALARAAPYFDEVWVDSRPSMLRHARDLWRLRRQLRGGRFDRVYDLQTSDRSSLYFHLMGPGRRPEWSGIARGASHPHGNPMRDFMHTIDRQRDQLAAAGIVASAAPDLAWIAADLDPLGLPAAPLVLLVPGGAAHRPEKRWPALHYAELARRIIARSMVPVIIGGEAERALCGEIASSAPGARDLTGRTTLFEIASLGRRAVAAIGNDTGPMHLLAAVGCRVIVLFSAASNPALTSPSGAAVTVLRRERLADLAVPEVAALLPVS